MPIYKRIVAVMQAERGKVEFKKLMKEISTSDSSMCRALRSLMKGGYVNKAEDVRGKYGLTEKGRKTEPLNIICARVLSHRKDARTGGIREMFWRYLRNNKITSADEAMPILVDAGKITAHLYQDINRYCAVLEMAGYIGRQAGQTTKVPRRIRWRLLRDTGQHSPKMSRDRKSLVDRNNGDVWKM